MIRGWCPTLAEPMLSGDGWLARVRPPFGVLHDVPAFAAACVRFGNGIVEVTSRAALQVRGLRDVAAFAAEMARLGLDGDDRIVFAPMLRNETPWGDLSGLPPKVFLAVDGGPLPMGDIGADMTIRDGRLIVGGLAVAASQEAVAALTAAFLRVTPPPKRFENARMLFAAAGLTPFPVEPVAAAKTIGPHPAGFVAGLPFGAIDANKLPALARLSGDGTLRPAPWRAFVLPGTGDVSDAVEALGLIAGQADARLNVVACPGGPACASGTVPARLDAATLRPDRLIHVSGCAKGCAHPGAADVTLVGEAGLYNVVRNGRAGDAPVLRGLTFAQAVASL